MCSEKIDLVPEKRQEDPFDDVLNPLSLAAVSVNKWMVLSYRLFGAMLDQSEHSFFLSTPQFISQLSFLMAVCPEKTIGLRREFGWSANSNEITQQIQHKAHLDCTIEFMRKWKDEIAQYMLPGKLSSARRVLCHPNGIKQFLYNTLQALRSHQVENKLFGGAKEVRLWADDNLMGDFKNHEIISGWDEESSELREAIKFNPEKKPGKNDEEREMVRKAPILLWVGSANVAILPEIFDAQRLYLLGVKYFHRITPLRTNNHIETIDGKMTWNTIILPTNHQFLKVVLIYDYNRTLCSFDEIREHIGLHAAKSPCIIRGTGLARPKKTSIYFPHWTENDFSPNKMAEYLRETADTEEVFAKGGFGDLAVESAVPQAGGVQDVSHFQQFSFFNFFNTPKAEDTEEHCAVPTTIDTEIVQFPFCVLLWDYSRHLPVYMGKITGKSVPRILKRAKGKGGVLNWIYHWFEGLH